MPEEQMTFEQALPRFVESVKNTKLYAQLCANLALRHFMDHGNTVHCQSFITALDDPAIAKNFVRKAAFIKWLVNFAPIKLVANKLVKDTDKNAVVLTEETYALASITPFWDFAPEMPIENFSGLDLVKALNSVITKFENSDKKKPADAQAVRTLAIAKEMVAKVHVPVNADLAQAA